MSLVLPGLIGANNPPSAWNGNAYSVSLDGTDDYVQTDFAPSTIGTGDYSVSFWFNINSGASVSEQHPYFFAFGASADTGPTNIYQGCGLTLGSGGGYAVRINNQWNSSYIQQPSSSTSDVTEGNWYHFLFVRDGNTLRLYKNGNTTPLVTLSNAEIASNDLNLGSELRIGYGYGAASRYVNGLIDEFAVFNSALNGTDASNIYNGGTPADLSSRNPLLWLRMGDNDDGTGTTITDKGSGGNDGTIENVSSPNGIVTDVPT
jgi:hypothetical protein